MLRKVAISAILAAALLVAGCGDSEETTSDADIREIRELVTEVNAATKEKDASAFCLLIQPSAIEETFVDIDRCVRETKPILEQAGTQPTLEVEDVDVDGDLASVTFAGGTGTEATFVREGGQWYVPLDQGEVDSSGSEG